MKNIEEILKKKIILFDGAMGTMLYERGWNQNINTSIANITNQDLVLAIHKEYLDVGVDIIKTNTFRANKEALKNTKYSVEEIVKSGICLAKKAKKDTETLLALDIGPIGVKLDFNELVKNFKEIVKVGVEEDVDLILMETVFDLEELKAALFACEKESDLPIFVTITCRSDGLTFMGYSPTELLNTIQGFNVKAVGINCVCEVNNILNIIDEFKRNTELPIIVQPNAGLPINMNNKEIYNVDEIKFKRNMELIINEGVKFIGGCCGTTPKFINEIKSIV